MSAREKEQLHNYVLKLIGMNVNDAQSEFFMHTDFDDVWDYHELFECRHVLGSTCSRCVERMPMRGRTGLWIGRDPDADIWINDGND